MTPRPSDLRLGVNVDHIATIRQARKTAYPDPVMAAQLAEQVGADGITVHLREDRRHIQQEDVRRLKQVLNVPLNLEMAATDEMLDFACEVQPTFCCLVPEKREELTTEGGLDIIMHEQKIAMAVQRLHDAGIQVSLFIEPAMSQVKQAKKLSASIIELHTGHYADAPVNSVVQQKYLTQITQVAQTAQQMGLQVHAGHGLHYHNVRSIVAIEAITELNIGHAIVARALLVGIQQAVQQMKVLLRR